MRNENEHEGVSMTKNAAAKNHTGDKDILNAIHNVVVAVDCQGRIVVYNEACERLFGVPAREAMGRPVDEVMPYSGLMKVLKTGQSHIGRKFASGNALFVVNRTPILANGRIAGAVGVAQEITELAHVAQELESVKQLKVTMETILDAGPDGYLVIDTGGRVTHMNRTFAELAGVSLEGTIGRHVREVIEDGELYLVPLSGRFFPGEVVRFKGREAVVMRYPIERDGRIVGAVSRVMFKDVGDLLRLADRVKSLSREVGYYRKELELAQGARYTIDSIIGQSPAMQELKDTARRVARGPSTVLIHGESGTGKELVAHAIHAASPRRHGPFVRVNCAAVPENLLESELFGYNQGAFTGARKGGQAGKFELADGGTIFLDEVGDMPLVMQAKLLRVLQEREIERLGEGRSRRVDVRVLAATNQDLEALLREGRFREDLYYRLNVVTIFIPPLRERIEDVHPLARHFIARFNREFGVQVLDLAPEVWSLLKNYHWPGNIREMENVIERAFNLLDGQVIEVEDLPLYLRQYGNKRQAGGSTLPRLLEQVEREALVEALAACGGNKVKAAGVLGISRAWLYKKMKQYAIMG
ncbi:MAG TPA: sigma-54-dependent Fis family transcriptional regulator [Spirochaetia bacterium]|nr:sigma-54-dependent Fis family transcriptional regulator [Spirochaetia bacterium]